MSQLMSVIEENQEEVILKDEERTRCEIYSRVVGYLRPTSQWNKGKQEEFKDRKYFDPSVSDFE